MELTQNNLQARQITSNDCLRTIKKYHKVVA